MIQSDHARGKPPGTDPAGHDLQEAQGVSEVLRPQVQQRRTQLPRLVRRGDTEIQDEQSRRNGNDPVFQRFQSRPRIPGLVARTKAEDWLS